MKFLTKSVESRLDFAHDLIKIYGQTGIFQRFARNRPATLNNQATKFRPSSAFYDIKKQAPFDACLSIFKILDQNAVMLLIFSEHENVGTDLFKPIFRIKAIGALVLLFDSEPHHGAF